MAFSSGSSSSMPASSATIVAAGENVAVSVKGRARPTSTGTSSSTIAMSSSARRDLPMPGSPRTLTSTGCPVLVARCRLSRRIASSLERPTNGIVRRAERGVRVCTGKPAMVSPSKPFAVAWRSSPYETALVVSATVVSPASTSPGAAAVWRRAAAFTTGPVTRSCPAGPSPVAASPDSMPTWTSSGVVRPSDSLSRRVRARIARPARTARSASSSCTVGSPNTAITASPMNFSARPRSARSSSDAASKKKPRISRARSASRRWARPVESTRSANSTVTILRSSVPSGVPTGVPQLGQKLAPSGSGSPQTGQGVMGSRIGAVADVPG